MSAPGPIHADVLAWVSSTARIDHDDKRQAALTEPLMTADEVAALLRVPRSSIYEYARRRRAPLPSVGIGRHRRFVREDLERWLRDQR
jgi:excisionase family DNA binding protein